MTLGQLRHSIVASIPACHAGDRGSIPRVGVCIFFRTKGERIRSCIKPLTKGHSANTQNWETRPTLSLMNITPNR